jgi:hypothetical protein
MDEVADYINNMEQDMPVEYSTLLFNNKWEYLLDAAKDRKRAINKAFKDKSCRYSDSFLRTQLDITERAIDELKRRSKEETMKKENLNEAVDKDIFDERDKKIFQDLKDKEEPETVYDLLVARIGQEITVGELNTVLQSIFGKYDDIFLLENDLYNADRDQLQDLVIWDDDDEYTLTFKVIDMLDGTIELTDVNVE